MNIQQRIENFKKESNERKIAIAIEEMLETIEAVDTIQTMSDIEQRNVIGNAHVVYNDKNAIGISGGKFESIPHNGNVISALSKTELSELQEAINNGKQGDGLYHKRIYCDGFGYGDAVGGTLEELAEDVLLAKQFAKKYKNAEQFVEATEAVEAGLKAADCEEIVTDCGVYILIYKLKIIIERFGNHKIVADLDNIESKLTRKDIKSLLISKLKEFEASHDYDDDYDDYDDDYDEYDEYNDEYDEYDDE